MEERHRFHSRFFQELLLDLPNSTPSELEERHKDMAASLQKVLEEILIHLLSNLYKETKSTNLCMAGGVALNSVANGKILRSTPFKDVFIQPASSDAGGSLGAALYAYNSILGNRRKYVLTSASLGPEYSTNEIKNYLDRNGIKYTRFNSIKNVVNGTIDLVLENKVIGWFQGRMEFGPRALGNRSILANPLNPGMKKILNEKVKHRETYRPFAPVVPADVAHIFFECDNPNCNTCRWDRTLANNPEKAKPSILHAIERNGQTYENTYFS